MAAWSWSGEALPGWPVEPEGFHGGPSSPAVADVTGDGEVEVLIGSDHDRRVWAFHATGKLVPRFPAPAGEAVAADLTADDLDGDGDMEVVWGAGYRLCAMTCPDAYATKRVEWGTFHGDAARTGRYGRSGGGTEECCFADGSCLELAPEECLDQGGTLGGPPPAPVAFRRGEANGDGAVDLSDGVFTLLYLFAGGRSPACRKAADAGDGGAVELTDASFLLNFLFLGGRPPQVPFPACGTDPTGDAFSCEAPGGC
ncbi:MAG: VCBS repeat-containing protein [Planctomycetes bacterium]|nr:VCBS repeat-containing protein [Planctomycetota bacterium]